MIFDRKKIIWAVVVVFGVVLIISVGGLIRKQNSSPSVTPQGQTSGKLSEQIQGPVTREAPPKDIVVPDTDSQNLQQNIAKPEVVSRASQTNNSSYRSFDIKIERDAFMPDTIIVYEGDTTNINVTAVDKDYDFTQPDYGFKVLIKKGETKKIQFGATAAGRFLFYCDSCGGPDKGPRGYVVIASKK
ncbi:MAG: cupredoxin domain-containing protein [Patescibacteria group bacterium]